MKNKRIKITPPLFFVASILYAVFVPTVYGVTCAEHYTLVNDLCLPSGAEIGVSDNTVSELLNKLLVWLLYIIGFLSILSIIYSGIQYIISGGDEKKTETAKKTLQYSVVGLAVALLSLAIVRTVVNLLNKTTAG